MAPKKKQRIDSSGGGGADKKQVMLASELMRSLQEVIAKFEKSLQELKAAGAQAFAGKAFASSCTKLF